MKKIYLDDIEYFLKLYENNHPAPYFSCSKEEIKGYLEELNEIYDVDDYFNFQYIIRCMIKKLNGNLDPHTGVRFNHTLNLPFQLKLFDNGLYVVNTTLEYEKIFGLKVKSINDVHIDNIIKESEQAYSYNTDGWRKRGVARLLSDVEGILMLPSINSNSKEIIFEFEGIDNLLTIEKFKISEIKNTDFVLPNYKYYLMDEDTIVFKYSLCIQEFNGQMNQIVEEMKKIINENNIKKFILDLRNNIGGGSEHINPLIQYLKESNLEKIVLTNGSVYSSAIIAIQKMQSIGAYFIGDKVGSTINHFGNLDCQSHLPNTGIKAVISTKYFGGNYVINNQEEFKRLNKDNLVIIDFEPDIIIPEKVEDILSGKDIIMDYAINHNKK